MKTVKVELAERSYEIVIGSGILDEADSLLKFLRVDKYVVISDTRVDGLYGDILQKHLGRLGEVHRIAVPVGEQAKSWAVAGELLEQLAALQVRRNHCVVTLGGGVVSDLGGFVAATYQRGVGVIHVPTTLLGQVDAAIGGKTGVNLAAGKNLAGVFYQPLIVIADVGLLQSLPDKELRSGLAEVIKYGLCFDPSILEDLSSSRPWLDRTKDSSLVFADLVYRCAGIKARIVSLDEKDRSGRIFLNYGHTFGHALEAAGEYRRFSHGEAISVGMMFAAHLALNMGLLDAQSVKVHAESLERAGLPVRASFDPDQISGYWGMDKKNEGIQRWVLLEQIGKPVIRADVSSEYIQAALKSVAA